ncbi:adenylate/guanylate cyclase domain-containing protein [Bradyrhizobium commune]|uniref:Adenylate/guanylate cyclase domain-containing protein n=1 Tax=Bradyrhizobium commune TaxID=83627 RepID=A0A7S9H009_9BRAD|nr:adenylate/guanylate cyclase domain-containing protein [Bradyrhizobium commune]QPF92505.1 adenylate/guanylate cyclase domain-containing protein [Bradyrhizobium commune]
MVQEKPIRFVRRLSAILAADVVKYSRLMNHDEETTHAKLTALLTDAVHPAIAEHGGRIVKNTGDGFLAEFPSAVEAVRAALQFQTRIHELTIDGAEDRRIAFRVGINVGDVIVEPHDIFGDGVNIAARLESIAEPGGICISSSAYDPVRGKIEAQFVDLGEQDLKNIVQPVRTYAVVRDQPGAATQAESSRPNLPPPPRLSIVVLPFANLSGDPEQDCFVDGVTESLTTDLSRIVGLFVIARNTAFTFKGRAVDRKQVGHDLKVRYILEGSVQRGGNRFRVNVQLVDAETGAYLWAERFDKLIAELFDMQDEIVSRLANTLGAQLIEVEARRAERSPRPNSMDLYFQGRALWNKGWWTPEFLAQAHVFFRRALELDPVNIEAMVGILCVEGVRGTSYVTDDWATHVSLGEAAAAKVLSLAPNHAFARFGLGVLLAATGRAAQGIAELERAISLDRNLAWAHAHIGKAKFWLGRAAETEAHVNEAFRLSPRDIYAFDWLMHIGFAKLQLTADAEAVSWFHRSIEANRSYPIAHFGLAAAYALHGSLNEARAAAKAGLALDPSFTIRRFRSTPVNDNPAWLAGAKRIVKGLHTAEVPEG